MNKARKIVLECEHVLWLVPPMPALSEVLYCRRCERYQPQMHAHAGTQTSYYDTWASTPVGGVKKYQGRCMQDGCAYTMRQSNWYDLRDHMEKHYRNEHTSSSFKITEVPIPAAKGTEPPF